MDIEVKPIQYPEKDGSHTCTVGTLEKWSLRVQTNSVHNSRQQISDPVKNVTTQPNVGTAVIKLKIWIHIAKAGKMVPNIMDLLLNILIVDKFKQGIPIKIPKGTPYVRKQT